MNLEPIVVTERIGTITDLMREHWLENESEVAPDGPKPIVEAYAALEASGGISAFGAFDGENMVGYVVCIVARHHHYGFAFAQHDVLFVSHAYRSSGLGLRLIRRAEEDARERGARMMVWHAKPGSALERIMSRRGYAVEDVMLRKEL